MHKKTILIVIPTILIAIVAGLIAVQIINFPNISKPEESQIQSTSESEPTSDDIEEVIEEAQAEDEEESLLTEEIKDTVKHVVDDAIGIFLKPDVRIVAIGDSLTQGVGDTTDNGGYVGILENTLKDNNQSVHVENLGKRGNRSDQLLKRLVEPEIVKSIQESDIVLVTVGANDIMKVVKENFINLEYESFVVEQTQYSERLREIFDTILGINPNSSIFLVGFYNPFEKYFSDIEQLALILDDWNTAGRTISSEYEQVQFVPTKDLFRNTEENLFSDDNFHPNVNGYKLIAGRVLNHIRPSIERIEEDNTTEDETEE
ncbi:hypothetical protein GH741_15515 [Aquibacillus halophilus]|uniref:SGNH hydrolase-type esterase domain-containing protein n=1 Tax=Aquibacillus halophilus TaxID=930132 RepID=A0A6A8DJU9_9BACI|nr:SGNH/GDSL hydrolase family protein [Aquibacillus halophilus]MRH44051.1 hypothetical protein [Aquibacillus halophilus]